VRVAFRVDASHRMGTGHVMRCLTLSDSLRKKGCECFFIHRDHSGNLASLIIERGYQVHLLPETKSNSISVSDSDYGQWLGITQIEDARQTIDTIIGTPLDWLVVDHYSLDVEWEHNLQPYTNRIFVIDDLENRKHHCDLLLDQNYSKINGRYQFLIPDKAHCFCGPKYSLLRPEYLQEFHSLEIRTGEVKRILIFFGGSDYNNMTTNALKALSSPVLAHLEVDVVIGSNNFHKIEINKIIANRTNTHLHQNLPHLASLMAKADLSLGGGGSSNWERCYMGLPSIVVALSENQRKICEALSEESYINYLGMVSEVNEEIITSAIIYMLDHPDEIKKQSESMKKLVPGDGLDIVTAKLMES
jgi:UDP-2,4-diacetamido-2,4,6-trideoxy-beta-L-altropyranose hydrolase